MTLLPFLFRKSNRLRLLLLKVLWNANSGVSAATVLSVLTRTQRRSSATTPTNTFRLTSSTTQRRQAVLLFPTCALATARSEARTTSTRLTLLHATTSHISKKDIRWFRTLRREEYSLLTASGTTKSLINIFLPQQRNTSTTTRLKSTQ